MLLKALLLVCAASLCVAINQVRPCALTDYNCIRNNLRYNSQCNPNVAGAIPTQYTLSSFRFEAPYFNASYIDQNLIIRNHDKCRVSEFFFDTDTRVVVIAIDCPNVILESNRRQLQHVSLKEDIITTSPYKNTYPLLRFTMNVPYTNGLNICTAFTFADVAVLPLNANPIFERESWLYRASLFLRYFINSRLCNFGCDF